MSRFLSCHTNTRVVFYGTFLIELIGRLEDGVWALPKPDGFSSKHHHAVCSIVRAAHPRVFPHQESLSISKIKYKMVKRGPPYEDDPDCQYIVIDSPWVWSGCQNKAGNKRDREFFNWVAVWLSFMLSPRIFPEELYYQSTVCTIYSISARGEAGRAD